MAIAAVAVIASFFPVFGAGFVNLDDPYVLLANAAVKNFDLSAMVFHRIADDYLPVTYISYAIENHLWGMKPFVFHFDNLVLHVLNFFLVFFFVRKLFGNFAIAFWSAFFFGVHPLRVESVAWVTERKDVLCGFFYFSALNVYLDFLRSKAKNRTRTFGLYAAVFTLTALALGAKSMAMTLPAAFLLIDFVEKKKINWRDVALKVPFFGLSFAAAYGATLMGNSAGEIPRSLPNVFNSLVFYVAKSMAPSKLCVWYEKGVARLEPLDYAAFGVTALVLAWAAWRAKASREVRFGAVFFVLAALPILQIFPFGNSYLFADRYSYIPAVGLFCALAAILYEYANVKAATAALVAVGAVSAAATFAQASVWKNSEALWRNVVAKYPDSSYGHFNLAIAYDKEGKFEDAEKENETALLIKPNMYEPAVNLGVLYLKTGKIDKAIEVFSTGAERFPASPDIHNGLGMIYLQRKNYAGAEKEFRAAVKLEPDLGQFHLNLATALWFAGKKEEAEREHQLSLQLRDSTSITHRRSRLSDDVVF